MEDVILYNESVNEVYVEGAISFVEKLKRLWKAFLDLLKRIKIKLKMVFNKDIRQFNKFKYIINSPEGHEKEIDILKNTMCDKWDTDYTKKLFAKCNELCTLILDFKFKIGPIMGGDKTYDISGTESMFGKLETVDDEIKQMAKTKPSVIKDGWSKYDAIKALIEEHKLMKEYFIHFDDVERFCGDIDYAINHYHDNMTSDTIECLTKLVKLWTNSFTHMRDIFNITSHVSSAMAFEDSKSLSSIQHQHTDDSGRRAKNGNSESVQEKIEKAKAARREYAQQARAIEADILKDMEDARSQLKSTTKENKPSYYDELKKKQGLDYHKEYYTKGMNGMDVILYNDNTEPQVTTESAVEEKEPLTLEEVDAYIESVMDELNDAMDLRSRMIQESDDAAADTDTSSGDADTSSDDGVDSPDTVEEGCSTKKDTKKTQPVKESYVLDGSAIFGESYNHMDDVPNMMPNRFYQEYNPDTTGAVLGAIVGHQVHNTIVIAGITANVMAIVTAVDSIVASATYKKKYGRFADDMKAVMDILKDSKDGTIKTDLLHKALSTLKDDCDTISGKGIISRKAQVNLTATERSEIKQLSTIIKDLKRMLTSKPDKAAERRISARIEDFVAKCETVTKLLNRGKNPGDVVKEYMS